MASIEPTPLHFVSSPSDGGEKKPRAKRGLKIRHFAVAAGLAAGFGVAAWAVFPQPEASPRSGLIAPAAN